MAGLRFTDLQSRPMEFLDFTSLTLDEFQQLVPPFATAFHARMPAWRMDGTPRTARRPPPLCPGRARTAHRPPQDPPQQAACYSGNKKDHTVKNVLLVNALLVILFLSDTHGGRVHDLRIAETTPYPLPAGSGLLQDLGFLSFTLPEVEILMPTKNPRGEELTLGRQLNSTALHLRRIRIEHVKSRLKRCHIV